MLTDSMMLELCQQFESLTTVLQVAQINLLNSVVTVEMFFQVAELFKIPFTFVKVARELNEVLPLVNCQMSSQPKLLLAIRALKLSFLLRVDGFLVTFQMVDVLERCSAMLLWAFEWTIFNSLKRVLAFLVSQHFFVGQKFRATKAAREVARMRSNVIHIIATLLVAFKTEIFDVDDLNLVHIAQVIRSLKFSCKCSEALAAWVAVKSFLLTQAAVLLNVFLQKRAGFVVGRAFRA